MLCRREKTRFAKADDDGITANNCAASPNVGRLSWWSRKKDRTSVSASTPADSALYSSHSSFKSLIMSLLMALYSSKSSSKVSALMLEV